MVSVTPESLRNYSQVYPPLLRVIKNTRREFTLTWSWAYLAA